MTKGSGPKAFKILVLVGLLRGSPQSCKSMLSCQLSVKCSQRSLMHRRYLWSGLETAAWLTPMRACSKNHHIQPQSLQCPIARTKASTTCSTSQHCFGFPSSQTQLPAETHPGCRLVSTATLSLLRLNILPSELGSLSSAWNYRYMADRSSRPKNKPGIQQKG